MAAASSSAVAALVAPLPPAPALTQSSLPSPATSSLPRTPRRSTRLASSSTTTPTSTGANVVHPTPGSSSQRTPSGARTPMRRLDAPGSGRARVVKDPSTTDRLTFSSGKRSVKKPCPSSSGPAVVAGSLRAAEKRRMAESDEEDEDGKDLDLPPPPPRPDFTVGSTWAAWQAPAQGYRVSLSPPGSRGMGRAMGALGWLDACAAGGGTRPGRQRFAGPGSNRGSLPTLQHYPSTLVTSLTQDVYRLPSTYPDRDFAPLFSVAFSHGAQRGGRQVLALSGEEGMVDFIDADGGAQQDRERERKRLVPHQNAIFDVAWSQDDTRIVTSSGDQTAVVSDVETGRTVAQLLGHRSSVKVGVWDPLSPTVISTASRDGNIHVYDLRVGAAGSSVESGKKRRGGPSTFDGKQGHQPVNAIRHAHAAHGSKKPAATARTATRSPTCLLYLPQRAHTLASAGTADGVIKLWDLRAHGSYTKKAACPPLAVEESWDAGWSARGGLFEGTKGAGGGNGVGRSRGVASMVLSKEGDVIYALGTDNKIHTHSPLNLQHDLGTTYTSPTLQTTFYSRLSLSPCGLYLASGSAQGDMHVWEVGGRSFGAPELTAEERDGVRFEFQGEREREGRRKCEVASVSWGACGIATCVDDYSLRVWKPNAEAARYVRDDPAGASWSWAGRVYG